MRITFGVVLLMTASALAAPSGKDDIKPAAPAVSGVRQQDSGRSLAKPSADVVRGRGQHDRRDGVSRDKHHRGHGGEWGFSYPYPPYSETWPFPPSPWSQFYYPYPPQYDPHGLPELDDARSTRGMVVPGDLPVSAGLGWYYCDAPDGYYPYVKDCTRPWTRIAVAPPPPGVAPPMSYADWQWCEETKGFFPYVASCRAGFEPVPVTAPSGDNAGPPSAANWFFCEEPKGYAPYVVQCKRDWRPVPAVPPPSVKITVRDEKGK